MKINNKTKKAIAAKVTSAKGKAKAKATTTTAGAAIEPPKGIAHKTMVAFLTGARGCCARSVEVVSDTDFSYIRATQNNLGLSIPGGGLWAKVDNKAFIVTGNRTSLTELGCYVNGKRTGAKCNLVTDKEFCAKAHKALIHWKADDAGIAGLYIGKPAEKGMSAVRVQYGKTVFYWQMETDSNPNNKHERGSIEPLAKGQVLPEVKF